MDPKTEAMTKALLEQLRIERAAADLSYVEIARRLEMGEQSVRRYFKGERDIPMPILVGLVQVLGIDLDTLVQRAAARLA